MKKRPMRSRPSAMHLQDPSEIPPKISVAFRVLAYCRSITDPCSISEGDDAGLKPSRALTSLEAGMEASAINLIRNWLNGELALAQPEMTVMLPPDFPGFEEDDLDDDEDRFTDEEAA